MTASARSDQPDPDPVGAIAFQGAPGAYGDLACREAKLIIEIDGSQHIDSEADERRTRFLESQGWTVIRFWNSEVNENPDGVAQAILLKAAECLGGTHPQPLPSREGSGIPLAHSHFFV